MTSRHPESYYAATAKGDRPRPALAGDVDCDVCVVGGGFTGLSTALHLAERGYDCVLLEAERLGWGASGRNGGQLGSGQRKSPDEVARLMSPADSRRLWDLAEEAKALVKSRIARHEIDCDLKPGVLSAAYKPADAEDFRAYAEMLQRDYGYAEIRSLSRPEMAEMLGTTIYHGGCLDSGAGHLHPLNYALGLAKAAEDAGARLYEESRVTALEQGQKPKLQTAKGAVSARYAVLACNGYLGGLEPRIAGRIMPINNYVLATEPLGEAGAKALIRDDVAVADSKFVIDYFRLSADKRLLFGGGETYRRSFPRDMKSFVRKYMLRVYPQLAETRIDYAWGGTLAVTLNRMPDFGRLAGDLYYAQGFSGHGVALTSLAGQVMAEAIAGTAERFDLFARIPSPKFPGGTLLRWPGLVVGMLYYSLRDKL
ncbi:MAG TPA: FAD-binding oxidoreductase [Kiloniellaceae bacterium]|nr:FAD-binding oxidoreductase [Kiloniellaceae bacterium]